MTKEVKNVPDLRFPGFENTWETKKLHQIVDVKDGTHESPKPTDDGYLLVTSKNLKNSTLDFSESYSISKEDYEDINKRSKVEIGDILFGMIGTIGNPILLEKDGFAIKNVALLKTSSLQEREYILNFLKSNSITKQFYKLNVGGTQKFISLRSIRDLKIDIPSSEEAIKIGGFFNKLDQQIELEEQKLSLLEEQKKGYMQQIFSQKLRFKDESGNDYPEWEEKKFSELLSYSSNGVDKKINKNNDIAYMVNYMDVFKKTKLNTKNRDLLMEITATKIQKEKNNLKKGDILFTPSSETREDIAKSTVVFEDLDNTVYSYHLIRLRPLDSNIFSLKYSNYLSEQNFISKQFRRLAQGAQRYTLTKEYFENIKLNLPHIKEQEKIGDFFSKLDEVINKQSQKVDELKLRKQGFLQKMFV